MYAHLLDEGWEKPRCVQACFTGALRVEKLDETELENPEALEGQLGDSVNIGTIGFRSIPRKTTRGQSDAIYTAG